MTGRPEETSVTRVSTHRVRSLGLVAQLVQQFRDPHSATTMIVHVSNSSTRVRKSINERKYCVTPVKDPINLDKLSFTNGSTRLTLKTASNIKTGDTRSFTIVLRDTRWSFERALVCTSCFIPWIDPITGARNVQLPANRKPRDLYF